jgi:DNA-directed RNA polymerase specialized sigma24 family protein
LDKSILSDYIDARELVSETERDIKQLKKKRNAIVTGSVKGSMLDFPYAEKHFHVEGTAYTYEDDSRLRYEEKILFERKDKAERVKLQVEEFLNTIPMRVQRIIRYKYFEGLSWEEVADRMGRKATGDSLRMELDRFIKEK